MAARILGWIILLVVFGAIFAAIVLALGFWGAVATAAIALVGAALLILGIELVMR